MADGKVIIDIDGNTSGFESALGTIGGIASKAVTGITVAFAGIGTAAAAVSKEAVDIGMDYTAAMSEVQAISGATAEEYAMLSEKAREMGATTIFSASDAADALKYMAMAGWQTEDMLAGIDGIMNLAAASGEGLGTVSDIVTDALTAFGMAAGDSGHFADVLAAASSAANTNVSMLGESFQYAGALAGTMGYSIEDVAAALGLMANSGIKSGQAGTTLRAALSRLVSPTEVASYAMEDLGLYLDGVSTSIVDADGNVRTFADTMEILRDAFSDLTEADKTYYAAEIFGQEAMSGMLAIINASAEDYEKLTDRINSASGAAENMAEVMTDNLSGDVAELQSAWEEAQLTFFDDADNPLRNVVQWLTEGVNDVTAAYKEGGFGGIWEMVKTDAAEAFAEPIEKAKTLANEVKTAYGEDGVGGVLDLMKEKAGDALEPFEKISDNIKSGIGELDFSNLGTELSNAFSDSKSTILNAGTDILEWLNEGLLSEENLTKLGNAGVDILGGIVSGLTDSENLSKHAEDLKKLGGEVLETLENGFNASVNVGTRLVSDITDSIRSADWTGVGAAAKEKLDEALAVLSEENPTLTVDYEISDADKANNKLDKTFDEFGASVSEAWEEFKAGWNGETIDSVNDKRFEEMQQAITRLDVLNKELKTLQSDVYVRTPVNPETEDEIKAVENMEALYDKISEVRTMIDEYRNSASEIFDDDMITEEEVQDVEKRADEIIEIVNKLRDSLSVTDNSIFINGFDSLHEGNGTTGVGQELRSNLESISKDVDAVQDKITAIGSVLSEEKAEELGEKAAVVGQAVGDGISSGVSEGAGEAVSVIEGIPTAAENAMTGEKGYDIGFAFAQGVAEGITEGEKEAIAASANLAARAAIGARLTLDINSPSKVARDEIGRMFSRGLALGIADGMPDVFGVTEGKLSEMIARAKSVVEEETSRFPGMGGAFFGDMFLAQGRYASDDGEFMRELRGLREDYRRGSVVTMDRQVVGRLISKQQSSDSRVFGK